MALTCTAMQLRDAGCMILSKLPERCNLMDAGPGDTPGGGGGGGARGGGGTDLASSAANLVETAEVTSRYRLQPEGEDPDRGANRLAPPRPSGWPGEVGEGAGPPPAEGGGAHDPRAGLDSESEPRIVLNVGGVRHETRLSTLRAIPNTRLSRLATIHTQLLPPAAPSASPLLSTPSPTPTLSPGLTPATPVLPVTEYFFDRHPAVFNAIIDFYRTGELHVPLEVCGAVVKRELDFWQIDEMEIKACCWRHYRSYIENQAILESFNNSLLKQCRDINIDHLRGWRKFQMQIWLILDHPRTSKAAMTYGIVSFLFVVTSIAGFCLETLPNLRPEVQHNVTTTCHGVEQVIPMVMTSNTALHVLDVICTVFFSVELVLRFVFSPNKLQFIISPMNITDLLALVPLYVTVIFEAWNLQACYLNEQFVIEIMFTLRIFRMLRVFHLVKHYQALEVLVYALRASLQELMMLFIFLLIAMLIFATMIYYAERKDATQPSDQFNTIPMGFWWAIITMTTVGYGDISPITPIGYIVGTACCVVGVLLEALTFPVIANNFTLFYTHVYSRPIKPTLAHALSFPSLLEDGGERGEGKGGGGGGGGRSSEGLRMEDEEEEQLLLRSPLSSPTHSGLRKASSVSAVAEPYMNGGALNRVPSLASSGAAGERGRRATGAGSGHLLNTPILAKFSDSNPMMDIILCRGRGHSSADNGRNQQQQAEQRSQYSTCSGSSRKTASDDGMRYHGETTL